MQRVAFLIEDTHVRLSCLLNPEALVLRRIAGLRARRSTSGLVTGVGLSDDPLLYTGGGRTELDLELLFDVSLAGSSISTLDVRDLTHAFWDLAENTRVEGARQDDTYGQPPVVRFIWGKTWNIPGHVVAVAERLEYFTADGAPRRSWLRMRMVRANEPGTSRRATPRPPRGVLSLGDMVLPEGSLRMHQIIGGSLGTDGGLALETPSLGGSVLAAADIIGAALINTNAARLLTAARNGIGSAVKTLWSHIGSLLGAEGRIGRVVRSALDRISSTLTTAWSAAKEQTVRAFSAAAATIAGAARRVWGSVQGALAPLGAAVAAEVEGAVQGLRRGVGIMGQAVAAVARATREAATRIAVATAKGIDMAVSHVHLLLDRAAAAAAELGQKLRETLRPALDDITGVLSAARAGGAIVTAAMARTISGRLQQIAGGAESLWSAGEATLARGLAAATKAMAQALHHIAAAREAMAAVHLRESSAVLQTRIEEMRSNIASLHGTPDEARVESLRDDLASIQAILDVAEQSTEPADSAEPHPEPSWANARQALEIASEQLATTQSAQAMASIAAQLDSIAGVIPSMERSHEEAMMATIEDAYSQSDVLIPKGPGDETIPVSEVLPFGVRPEVTDRRVVSGQRLDQLAYQYYGDATFWRLLALFNDVDHPLHLPTGMVLRVPPSSVAHYAGDVRADNGDRARIG